AVEAASAIRESAVPEGLRARMETLRDKTAASWSMAPAPTAGGDWAAPLTIPVQAGVGLARRSRVTRMAEPAASVAAGAEVPVQAMAATRAHGPEISRRLQASARSTWRLQVPRAMEGSEAAAPAR